MTEIALTGCRVLVVEDEYLLADDLHRLLARAGAEVIGPVGDVAAALAIATGDSRIDAALLDINLHEQAVFPVAAALADRGVPFAFTTGYDAWALPARFAAVQRLEKPVDAKAIPPLVAALAASTAPR